MRDLPTQRRTAEEAVMQADAKDRIRTARSLRASGAGLAGFGVASLTWSGTWSPSSQAVLIQIHGGPSFTLSFTALLGILAVVVGPLVVAVAHWRLARAIKAAESNPITAPIIHLSLDD